MTIGKKKKIKDEVLLILSNPQSTEYISNYFSLNGNDSTLIVIDKQQDFDNLQLLFDFSNASEIYCLICVEIGWNDNLVHGYELALDLMKSELANKKVLHLQFYSFKSRTAWFKYTKLSSRYRNLSKSFQHFQLPFLLDNRIELTKIRKEKWDYLRKFTLSTGGFLSGIKHDLEGLKTRGTNDVSSLKDITNLIRNNESIFGDKIINLLNDESKNFDFIVNNLILEIEGLLNILPEDNNKINKQQDDNQNRVKPKMIIIEDNEIDREKIHSVFQSHFDIPKDGIFNSGEKVMEYLEKDGAFTDILICDLELLNNDGIDNDLQGIDIIMEVKSRYPHIVIRIITNIPRKGINYLVGSKILANEIVYKRTLYENDYSYINDVVEKLNEDVKGKQKLTHLRGPENTYWTSGNAREKDSVPGHLKKYFYHLKFHGKLNFDEIISNLQDINSFQSKINCNFPASNKRKLIAFPDEKNESESIDYLKTILRNRLFWIDKVYHSDNKKIEVNTDEYLKYFDFDNKPSFNKNYWGFIGFGCIISINNTVKITFGEFLDDERKWYAKKKLENQQINSRNKIDYLNSELKGKTVEILDTIKNAGGQFFSKDKYPTITTFDKTLINNPNKFDIFISIFEKISNEKPSSQIRSTGDSRKKIIGIIKDIISSKEFHSYPANLKEKIKKALEPLKS